MSVALWEIEWSAGEDAADSYNVYVEAEPPGVRRLHLIDAESPVDVELADVDQPAWVWIAPVIGGAELEEGDWAKIIIQPNDTTDFTAPPDLTNFVVRQVGTELVATFDEVENPHLKGYEIRRGSDYATGVKVVLARGPGREASWGWAALGAHAYYAKAITTHGLESDAAVSSSLTVAGVPLMVETGSGTTEEPGFSGTGTEIDTNRLQPTQRPTDWTTETSPADWTDNTDGLWWWEFYGDADYITTAIDNGATVTETPHIEIDVESVEKTEITWDKQHGPDINGEIDMTADDPTVSVRAPWEEAEHDALRFNGSSFDLADGIKLRIHIEMTDEVTPTTWTSEVWVPGATYTYRHLRWRIYFLELTPLYYFRITGITYRRYRRNLKDEGEGEALSSGTAITFAQPFSAIPVVQGLRVAGAGHVEATAITALGCTLTPYTNATPPVAVTTDVTWQAQGV